MEIPPLGQGQETRAEAKTQNRKDGAGYGHTCMHAGVSCTGVPVQVCACARVQACVCVVMGWGLSREQGRYSVDQLYFSALFLPLTCPQGCGNPTVQVLLLIFTRINCERGLSCLPSRLLPTSLPPSSSPSLLPPCLLFLPFWFLSMGIGSPCLVGDGTFWVVTLFKSSVLPHLLPSLMSPEKSSQHLC